MISRFVDLCVVGVEITAPPGALARMIDYIGHLPMVERLRCGLVLRLDIDPLLVQARHRIWRDRQPNAIRFSHPEMAYHQWADAGRRILIPASGPRHVIICERTRVHVIADSEATLATVAVRVLRQLIMRGAEHAGGGCVHAGAVVLGEWTIMVGGRAGAGKTAVLTTLIEHHAAAPIGNDRLAVVPHGAGIGWAAIGVPFAWRITPAGVNASPRLRAAVAAGKLSRGTAQVDNKIEFSPAEVATHLGAATVPSAPIDQIIILVRGDGAPCVPPDRANLLNEHLGFGERDPFTDDWLSVRHVFLHASRRPLHANLDLWTRLGGSLPVTVLPWTGTHQLPDLAATIATRRPQ